MAVECAECSTETEMPFQCKFCKEPFCLDHRLPEKHDCMGLEEGWEQISKNNDDSERNTAGGSGEPYERISDRERIRKEFETVDPQVMGTTPDKEETIDDRSPDVARDGSLVQESEDQSSQVEDTKLKPKLQIYVQRIKGWLSVIFMVGMVAMVLAGIYLIFIGMQRAPVTQMTVFGADIGLREIGDITLTADNQVIIAGVTMVVVGVGIVGRMTGGLGGHQYP